MCGLTPYIACLSPISMSRAVSCLLSCRHSTAALRDSITILAWFCSNSSFKKTSPETSLVISFVNNFFKWWFCENNLKKQNKQLILCLLVSSLITFASSLDSDQDRWDEGPDLSPNWLTLLWYYFWKNFLGTYILTVWHYYSAYRSSVNIAFLRLFLYVQTNHRKKHQN